MGKGKNSDKTKKYEIKQAKVSNKKNSKNETDKKEKKIKKKHSKLKKFFIINFILIILLGLIGVGVFAGIFFSDKWEITKDDLVFDLYCGIGTISLFMAKYAKKVYGIEIVEQAIEDAKNNAKINNVENTEFIAGDVENILTDLIENQNSVPDIIMVDALNQKD